VKAAAALVLLLAGCGAPAAQGSPSPPGVPTYYRSEFGTGWARVHGNCDTREVVLERDAGRTAVDSDGDGCKDDAPVLDVYTGRMVVARSADVDHVFSLKAAWDAGAWKWTSAQRRAFAQDQANLRAVSRSVNESKGDRTPAQWNPPARSGACWFAMTYRATAERWHLVVSPADDAALNDMLTTC
jgi:hypothetical protein